VPFSGGDNNLGPTCKGSPLQVYVEEDNLTSWDAASSPISSLPFLSKVLNK